MTALAPTRAVILVLPQAMPVPLALMTMASAMMPGAISALTLVATLALMPMAALAMMPVATSVPMPVVL